MNRATALRELLAKVEAGDGDLDRSLPWSHAFGPIVGMDARNAYRGSLDAARSLHEAVLPGWLWETDGIKLWRVWTQREGYHFHEAPIGKNPARSWLIAILRALLAETGEEG